MPQSLYNIFNHKDHDYAKLILGNVDHSTWCKNQVAKYLRGRKLVGYTNMLNRLDPKQYNQWLEKVNKG